MSIKMLRQVLGQPMVYAESSIRVLSLQDLNVPRKTSAHAVTGNDPHDISE